MEGFINSKKNSGKGPMVVRQQPKQKGVNIELIALALEAVEEEWYALAQALHERKYQGEPFPTTKKKPSVYALCKDEVLALIVF